MMRNILLGPPEITKLLELQKDLLFVEKELFSLLFLEF